MAGATTTGGMAVACSSCRMGTGSIGTGGGSGGGGSGGGGGGGVVGVGTSGGSLADEAAAEWFNTEGRLSSRMGGAGGSRCEGAGLLQDRKSVIITNVSPTRPLIQQQKEAKLQVRHQRQLLNSQVKGASPNDTEY